MTNFAGCVCYTVQKEKAVVFPTKKAKHLCLRREMPPKAKKGRKNMEFLNQISFLVEGFAMLSWKHVVMWIIGGILIFLAIKKGMEPTEAYEKSKGTYGRFADAVKYIDPRKE